MYEEWSSYWPTADVEPFASFINTVQKYVASSTALSGDWGACTRIPNDVEQFVADLKQTAGRSIGVHGSIRLAQSLLRAGLVDELRLVITPTTVGSGQRLFGTSELQRWQLLSSDVSSSGELLLHYRRHAG